MKKIHNFLLLAACIPAFLCSCASGTSGNIQTVPVQQELDKAQEHIQKKQKTEDYSIYIDADVDTHSADSIYQITLEPDTDTLQSGQKEGLTVDAEGGLMYEDPDESHQYYGDDTLDSNNNYGFITSKIPDGFDKSPQEAKEDVLSQINAWAPLKFRTYRIEAMNNKEKGKPGFYWLYEQCQSEGLPICVLPHTIGAVVQYSDHGIFAMNALCLFKETKKEAASRMCSAQDAAARMLEIMPSVSDLEKFEVSGISLEYEAEYADKDDSSKGFLLRPVWVFYGEESGTNADNISMKRQAALLIYADTGKFCTYGSVEAV